MVGELTEVGVNDDFSHLINILVPKIEICSIKNVNNECFYFWSGGIDVTSPTTKLSEPISRFLML